MSAVSAAGATATSPAEEVKDVSDENTEYDYDIDSRTNHGEDDPLIGVAKVSTGFRLPILPEWPSFLYMFALVTQFPVLQFWLFDHFSKQYHWKGTDNSDYCQNKTHTRNDTDSAIENEVQSKTNQYIMYTGFVSSFTAIFPTLFLGPLTDKFGRKFGFFCSFLGLLLCLLLMTLIYYFNLSPNFLFISSFFLGISGSYGLFLAAAFGMIADVTSGGKRRGFRIASLEASIALASSAGTITSGIWVTTIGYVWPMVFSMALLLLASIYTLLIPETLIERNDRHFSVKNLLECFHLYVKDTLDRRRFMLILCVLCFMINVWTYLGDANISLLYLLHQPFCWSKTQVTIFSGVLLLLKWIVVLLFLLLGKRCISEPVFALIGCLSVTGGYLIKGLAQNSELIFVSAGVFLVSEIVTPMCRTMMSKSVSATEQGALFGGLGMLQMVVSAFAGISMSGIYNAGLTFYLGLPFLVLAGFGVCNVILFIILIFHMKRKPPPQETVVVEEVN